MATHRPDRSSSSSSPEAPATAGHPPARSYRDLERVLTPLPDSSHRPTRAEAAEAEVPRPVEVSAEGGAVAADDVRAAIASLAAIDAGDLDVAVIGSSVRLSGSVARTSDRDRVVAAVHQVAGVDEVVDHLRVRLE